MKHRMRGVQGSMPALKRVLSSLVVAVGLPTTRTDKGALYLARVTGMPVTKHRPVYRGQSITF